MSIKLLPDLDTQKRIADATEEIASKLGGSSILKEVSKTKGIDYVDYILQRQKLKQKPIFWKTQRQFDTDTVYRLNVLFPFETGNIIHSFCKENHDDFIKWDVTDLNGANHSSVATNNIPIMNLHLEDLNRSGTWVDTYRPLVYTTQVGATFGGTFLGTGLKTYHQKDNRGGLWRFVIDGDVDNPIDISVWNSTIVIVGIDVVFGLEYGEHTFLATFMGDDPEHTPSETARGWLFDNVEDTIIKNAAYGNSLSGVNLNILEVGSNREFAFHITYEGVTNYVPMHSNIGSAFKIDNVVYKVDGVVIDFDTLPQFNPTSFEKIEIIQHFNGKINDTNVTEQWLTTTIYKNGLVTVDGMFKALQNFTFDVGYYGMLPLDFYGGDTIIDCYGNVIVNDNTNKAYTLANSGDDTFSFIGLNSTRKNIATAISSDRPRYTLLQKFNTGKDLNAVLQTTNTYLKLYNRPFLSEPILNNYVGIFKHRFVTSLIKNVHDDVINI